MAETWRDRAFIQTMEGKSDIALWYSADGTVADYHLVNPGEPLTDGGHAAKLAESLGKEVVFISPLNGVQVETLLGGVI